MLGRPAYAPALYQIKSAVATPLVSFRSPGQNPERSSRGDRVELRLQSVVMADVWWRWRRIRTGYLEEFGLQSCVECSRGVQTE